MTVPMVPATINGRWTLKLPDYRAERHVIEHDWECERLDAMSKNIFSGDTVFDIGAEEGDLSGLFAVWARPGKFAMFEPNPRVLPNIRAIWEANDLDPPALCFAGFASASDEPPMPALEPGWPPAAYGPMIRDHGFAQLGQRPDIPQVRIDTVVGLMDLPPDVITMDVEGSELHVLRGAEQTLRKYRPIVFASVHPQFLWDQYQIRAIEVHRFMAGLGYRAHYLGHDHEAHWAWDHPAGRQLVGIERW